MKGGRVVFGFILLLAAAQADAESCSCTAPDGSCSSSISCTGGCFAICGNGGFCTSQCSSDAAVGHTPFDPSETPTPSPTPKPPGFQAAVLEPISILQAVPRHSIVLAATAQRSQKTSDYDFEVMLSEGTSAPIPKKPLSIHLKKMVPGPPEHPTEYRANFSFVSDFSEAPLNFEAKLCDLKVHVAETRPTQARFLVKCP